MPAQVTGAFGYNYNEIASFLDISPDVVRQSVTRGHLDPSCEESLVLFAIYKSKGEFRDRINRTILAWEDWASGREFTEPSLAPMAYNPLRDRTIQYIWHNEDPIFARRCRRALDKDKSALAVNKHTAVKQETFKQSRKAEPGQEP